MIHLTDIRKIINTCQLSTHKGELKIDTNNVIEGDLKSKLVEIFVSKDDKRNKYMKIRQSVDRYLESKILLIYILTFMKK